MGIIWEIRTGESSSETMDRTFPHRICERLDFILFYFIFFLKGWILVASGIFWRSDATLMHSGIIIWICSFLERGCGGIGNMYPRLISQRTSIPDPPAEGMAFPRIIVWFLWVVYLSGSSEGHCNACLLMFIHIKKQSIYCAN